MLRRPLAYRLLILSLALLPIGAGTATSFAATTFSDLARHRAARPTLLVVISIDQFRADYLARYGDLLRPAVDKSGVGGFRYLMDHGAYFVDAQQSHYPLLTGPGHAAILTGAYPRRHGIVSNLWWERSKPDDTTYCVSDSTVTVVGAVEGSTTKPMGPAHLRTTTVGDELKLATAGHARVVSIAFKDRAAILMGGHAADAAIWLDESQTKAVHWVSSTAYLHELPSWAKPPAPVTLPFEWSYPAALSKAIAARTFYSAALGSDDKGPSDLGAKYGPGHPHQASSVDAFTVTPAATRLVLDTAKSAVVAEHLGVRPLNTDLLALSLSSFDYAGHAWGPYSPELLDHVVQTDAALSDFFRFLNTRLPGGLASVLIVLTADHGVSPVPEDAVAFHIPGGRVDAAKLRSTVEDALRSHFGKPAHDWFAAKGRGYMPSEGWIYFNDEEVQRAIADGKASSRRQIQREVVEAIERAQLPGIYQAFSREDLLEGTSNGVAARVARGAHPVLAGDVAIVQESMFQFGSNGAGHVTSHGSPYIYDAHVPLLLAGPGIRPGVYSDAVEIVDLAPTLSAILGIEAPSGSEGHLLRSALQ
jgi:predicted AlkP superfamily pyrophosphatase or phosphodiesterase